MASLINEITSFNGKISLVLDDYHLIREPSIDESLAFLLDHQPQNFHLIIATRDDPQLPLARLRAKNQLNELRAVDLCFSPAETAEFLNQVMGLDIPAEDINILETRTEGWIAGLQLAAFSLQGQKDTAEIIKSFSGSHRFVMDYLIEEVLEKQPEDVQAFLLRTSILDRMTGSLCNALTDQVNGQQTLEYLEKANLFIVPLDNERRWYRYHHLFSDLLRQRLHQSTALSSRDRAGDHAKLHIRASEWYRKNDLPADAVQHAIAAKDFARAADLTELAWPAMSGGFQSITWLGWVKLLPEELVRARPVL
jgi:LuxR family maltose regulon positive regulatory protein